MRIALLLVLFLTAALPAAAQEAERQAAEQRLRELRAQVGEFEKQISRTTREETDATQALEELDREIAVREALIESYRQRQTALTSETARIESSMTRLERELDALRSEYAAHARNAYMRGRTGDLALILSAGSINQMIVRTRYLQRFSQQRQRKLAQIGATQDELAQRQAELDASAARIETLIAEGRAEQQALSGRKRQRTQLVSTLRQRRSDLQSELEQRQQDINRLNARIQEMIAADAAEQARIAAAARSASNSAEARAARAAESRYVELSGSFLQNRGRLPWPAQGVVTGTFGLRTHPVHGTKTRSIGIELSTQPTASVQAVFDGTVSRVFVMPGYGTCVMVSHGEYATVYGNLSSVDVRQGEQVRAGQGVGRAGTANDPLGAGLFFALFSGTDAVDPAGWLQRR